ncbi:DUF5694 domain-containing protein [Caenibacillus caldisaponilyticus]|uniref:DUF5694 domain-containing protein n=1 Tax=Caenibacillus caldisaponilyticus TaxID=1674942 RepID=UPI0009887197|nr:DUF5694 domain-containing protein [Caenibacillus caldisaponilyticus]
MAVQTQPHILVLGTYHMSRGKRDVHQLDAGNIQEAKKQREIREVVDRLTAFRPTKVAVEYDRMRADLLQQKYKRFLDGHSELENDEIEQLGFRIAKEMGHSSIYAVDWNRPVGGVPLGYVYDFAKEEQPDVFEEMTVEGKSANEKYQQLLNSCTLREFLLYKNSQSEARKDHQQYIKYVARVATDDYYVGIDWLANYWYRRNLIIYANTTRLIETPRERILVIYGAGHKYLLDRFFLESGLFHVEKVEDYL